MVAITKSLTKVEGLFYFAIFFLFFFKNKSVSISLVNLRMTRFDMDVATFFKKICCGPHSFPEVKKSLKPFLVMGFKGFNFLISRKINGTLLVLNEFMFFVFS